MGIIGRILAFVVMGAILPVFAFYGLALAVAGGEPGDHVGLISLTIGALLAATLYLAAASPTARIAWGRLSLLAALASFALPLETFVGMIAIGEGLQPANHDPAVRAGAAVGTGIATLAVSSVAITRKISPRNRPTKPAFFALRHAPRPVRI